MTATARVPREAVGLSADGVFVVSKWIQRLRGALGIGLAWGVAWFSAGMAIMITSLVLTGSTGADVPYPVGFGLLGFVAGVSFSGVLGVLGRSRRFDQMSLPGFGMWGAAGGALLALGVAGIASLGPANFLSVFTTLIPVFGTAGALSAAGSLAIARKAEGHALTPSDEIEAVGLTDAETKELLGG